MKIQCYAIVCTDNGAGEPQVVYVSSDYDDVFERRAAIDSLGQCHANSTHHIAPVTVTL